MSGGIPYSPEQGLLILAGVSVLLIVVILISVWKRMGIAKEFLIGLLKGGTQLAIIALLLTLIFRVDWWYIPTILIVGIMAVVGGRTSAMRASRLPDAWKVTTPAIVAGASLALVVLLASQAMPYDRPEFIIPLAGMAFGNSMTICSLALERLMREFELNKAAIETRLSLGANSKEAMEELYRIGVRAALIPTIDRLKTLGIIFIPGAMAGLLIAGTDPLVAAEYQIIVYLMIVGGGIVTSLVAVSLVRRSFFTRADQIAEWV